MAAAAAPAAAATQHAKIAREKPVATPLELEVAKCLTELESNPDCGIAPQVECMKIYSAQEVAPAADGERSIVLIAFPFRIFMDFVRKIQGRLVGELEKKLRRSVVVYARRRTLTDKVARYVGFSKRPYSRTRKAVQDALLEDIVGPSQIVGRRLCMRVDGSRLMRVFLDPKDKKKENIEEKLEAFSAAYKKLTTHNVVFSFEQ